jgi:hypothetical protein
MMFALITALAIVLAAYAQAFCRSYSVSGRVTHNAQPVRYVHVYLVPLKGATLHGITDGEGRFVIDQTLDGSCIETCSAGYYDVFIATASGQRTVPQYVCDRYVPPKSALTVYIGGWWRSVYLAIEME